MTTANYERRRAEIEHYFDRTAADTWAKLTSDAPVGKIRQTVRAGRDDMRNTLLSWLPGDLQGRRILDAGCGTGMLAMELAARGADVVAIDLSPTLIDLATERAAGRGGAGDSGAGNLQFMVGDMRHLDLGYFDHVVAMDSLIHYSPRDGLQTLESMVDRVAESILFTFAPRTGLLSAMHAVGQLFPRGNRSPAIEPVSEAFLERTIGCSKAFNDWELGRRHRVHSGFYISHAMEIRR